MSPTIGDKRQIEAWGAVLLENVLGKEERFDAVLLKFDHGKLPRSNFSKEKSELGSSQPLVAKQFTTAQAKSTLALADHAGSFLT
jgi:hypothetical protein